MLTAEAQRVHFNTPLRGTQSNAEEFKRHNRIGNAETDFYILQFRAFPPSCSIPLITSIRFFAQHRASPDHPPLDGWVVIGGPVLQAAVIPHQQLP